jgi:hypothetical protein
MTMNYDTASHGQSEEKESQEALRSRVFKLKLRDPVDGGTWDETTVWSYSAWGNSERNRWGWPDGNYLIISNPVKEGANWFVKVDIDAEGGESNYVGLVFRYRRRGVSGVYADVLKLIP